MSSRWSLLASLALVAACGAGLSQMVARPPRVVSDGDRTARLAAGAVEILSDDGAAEGARLRRVAELDARLGNVDDAVAATYLMVDQARVVLALAQAGQGDLPVALKERDDAVAFALDLARRLDVPRLTMHVIGPAHVQAGQLDELAAAAPFADEWTPARRSAVWLALADRPEARARLERRWGGFAGAPRLTLAELARLGAPVADLIEARLLAAAGDRDLPTLREATRALVAADAWNLHGRLAAAWLADVDAGRLDPEGVAVVDVIGRERPIGAAARLERAHRAHPEAPSLALALAARYSYFEMLVDERAVLAPLAAAGRQGEVAETARFLLAVSALGAGDVAAYTRWSAHAPGAARSAYLASEEMGRGRSEGAPAAFVALGRVATRRAFAADLAGAGTNEHDAHDVATDAGAPRALRERALAVLRRGEDRFTASVIQGCLDRRLDDAACATRAEEARQALGANEDDDDDDEAKADHRHGRAGAIIALADSVELPGEVYDEAFQMDQMDLLALHPTLVAQERTPAALSSSYVVARVLSEIARSDAAAAGAALDRGAPLLLTGQRVGLRLAVADLRDGVGAAEVLGAATSLGDVIWYERELAAGDPQADALAEVENSWAGTSRVRALERGLAYWRLGARNRAADELAPLARQLSGAEGAELSALVAIGARWRQDSAQVRASADRAHELAPHAPGVRVLDAVLAEDADDRAAAAAARLALVHCYPSDLPSLRAALHALARWQAGADGARAVTALLAGLPGQHGNLGFVPLAVADGVLRTGADVADALDADLDGAKALAAGARFQRIDEIALTVAGDARGRLASDDPEGLVEDARRAARWLEGTRLAGEQRALIAWLWFVAGDGERALAAATRAAGAPRDDVWGRHVVDDGPLAANATVRILAPLRARLSDALAAAIYTTEEGRGEPAKVARELLAAAPGAYGALATACHDFGRADQAAEALSACRAAYEATGDVDALTDGTWALSSLDAAAVRKTLPDLDGFVAAARRRVRFDAGGLWLHNLAIAQDRRGRDQEALELELEAWVRGFEPTQHWVPPVVLDAAPWAARLQDSVRGFDNYAVLHHRFGITSMRLGEVAAARTHERAARAWIGPTTSAEQRGSVDGLADLVEMAEADLDARLIDAAGVRRVFEDSTTKASLLEWEALESAWPRSILVQVMVGEQLAGAGRGDEALTRFEAAHARHPRNIIIGTDLHAQLVRARRYSDASKLQAALEKAHPGDARLAGWKVPEGADGAVAPLPDFAATPAAFDARRAQITDAQLEALAPHRAASVESAAEAFLPGDFKVTKDLVAQDETSRVGIVAEPRADRCEGEACLSPLVDAMAKTGFTGTWKAPIPLPAGEGYQTVLAGPGAIMWVVVVPAGAHTFTFFAASPAAGFEAALPGFELIARSFRPLDHTVAAGTAEALRGGHALDDVSLWRARREAALAHADAAACPIAATLAGAADDATRGALLLDALLAAPAPAARRALVACSAPTAPSAAPAALVALLDEDPRVHAWGRAATAAAAARVRTDAERVLLDGDGVALSSRTDDDLLPPFGVLEVLDALPAAEQQRFAATIAARSEPRWQRLALLLPGLVPGVLDRAHLRDVVKTGAPGLALLATWALAEAPEAADLDAVRARADVLVGPFDARTRSLATTLAEVLVERLDAADAPRFERLAVEAEKDPAGPAVTRHPAAKHLRELGKLHARGLALVAGGKPPARVDADDGTLALWVARKRARAGRADAAITDAMLAKRPLAQLVPGRGWTFARVAQPSLFAAGARDLGTRARGATDADTPMLRRIMDHFAESLAGHVYAAPAGLDLTKPIECASPGRDELYVCVAQVKDRDAVRAELARHDSGDQSGVHAPLALATKGFVVPMALALVPAFVDMIASSWGEGSGDAERLLVERARGMITIAGHTLERVLTVELRDGFGSREGGEVFLFAGDRLWLFSDAHLAADVLAAPPARGASLAESPRFAALTKPWKDAGALQAVTLGASSFLDEEVAFEVATSEDGIDFHVGGHANGTLPDIGPVVAALPDDAASWFAIGMVPDPDVRDSLDLDPAVREGRGAPPPMWLVPDASLVAFGWYPEAGQPLWSRWVGAVGLDARVREALEAALLDLPEPGAFVERDGVTWARRGDGVLVFGAPRALVEQAIAHPATHLPLPSGSKKGARQVIAGHLDGARAAAALLGIATGKRAGDDSVTLYKMAALVVGSTRAVDLAATQDDTGAYRLQARVALKVAAPGAAETPMVDAWLASRSLRNSARLPRVVSRAELGAPIVLDLEVDDARATAARAFPTSPRVHVSVVDDTHLRVEVAPGPTLDQATKAAPLGERERRAALAPAGRIVVDAPELQALARQIVPAGSSPAEAARRVVAWLQKNLVYEVTPESLDALTILTRGRGDCTEYSILAVSLLRAAGVPAELREGMALDGGEMVAHAWVAFHDGTGWREIDPTFGVTFVDAGHLETSVMDFVSLVSVGRLKVLGVTAAPAAK